MKENNCSASSEACMVAAILPEGDISPGASIQARWWECSGSTFASPRSSEPVSPAAERDPALSRTQLVNTQTTNMHACSEHTRTDQRDGLLRSWKSSAIVVSESEAYHRDRIDRLRIRSILRSIAGEIPWRISSAPHDTYVHQMTAVHTGQVSAVRGTDIEWSDRHEIDPVHSTFHEVGQGGACPTAHSSQHPSTTEPCGGREAHHMRRMNSPEKLVTYIHSSPNQTCAEHASCRLCAGLKEHQEGGKGNLDVAFVYCGGCLAHSDHC